MIGLGPHRMTTFDWVFSLGLTAVLVLLAIVVVWWVARSLQERPR